MDGIYVKDLNITSGIKKIIDGITLSVEPGEVYGLLGTDRVKNVLLRLIGGGHSGKSVYIDNDNVAADVPITEDVCYVVTAADVWDWMTVFEYSKYTLSSFALSAKDLDKLQWALNLAGLSKKADCLLRYLTLTEKKLLQIALQVCRGKTKIIINADELIFSPRQFNELNTALTNFKCSGKSILIALRDARLVGSAFNNIGILKQGKIIISGEPSAVCHLLKKTCYTIRPTGNIKAIAESIRNLAKGYDVKISGEKLYVYADGDKLPKDIVNIVASADEGIKSLKVKIPTLNESLKKTCSQLGEPRGL